VDFFVDYLVLLKPWHRKRIVLHTHGGYFHTPWMAGLKRAYFKTVTRLVLKGCYRVIACSENDREMFGRISPNVVRVDNGVDVRRFSAIAKDIEPGRLLYVGRLDEHKGLEDLVRTVGAVGRIGARVRLVVAGPDYSGLAPSLKRLASDLGLDNILFLGALRDEAVAGELAKSHIFVSASRYEAFGISAVEAMASGTLCVLNDIPAFRYISSGGETPYITDFSDAEKSARVIVDALSMDRERYGMLASRAREASARYDWRAVAARITELYR
jgi:alpha-1,3-mannosyltransferase